MVSFANRTADGSTLEIISAVTTILHDAEGRIRHLHKTMILQGGTIPTEPEMEAVAMKAAGSRGASTDGFSVLHVPTGSVEPGRRYKVDTATHSLVPLPDLIAAPIVPPQPR